MCGRYTLAGKPVNLEKHFRAKLKQPELFQESYNITPGTENLIIQNHAPSLLSGGIWGLIPFWTNNEHQPKPLINARVESLRDKAHFKKYIQSKRCIVPANGYFEWEKSQKSPFYIKPKEAAFWGFAGVFETQIINNQALSGYAIITIPALKEIESIHDRMPLILPQDAYEDWLNGERLNELFDYRISSTDLSYFRVSQLVNSPRNKHINVIQQIPETGSLF